jgi:hypothetical protein
VDDISKWEWIKDYNTVTEEELEPWAGRCDTPETFYKTYKEILPNICSKAAVLTSQEQSWNIINNAYADNKQEIIPYILALNQSKQDLECVKIFYTKLHSLPNQRSLISLNDLYQLYKNK